MKRKTIWVLAILVGCAFVGLIGFRAQLRPTAPGKVWLVRFNQPEPLASAFQKLAAEGIVRNPTSMVWYAKWRRNAEPVAVGTYRFQSGKAAEDVLKAMRSPVRQMVRLPETWWIARTAERLEANNVCTAEEYIELTQRPSEFQNTVAFPLPKDSLEGYLYPDTYDLPPLLGAKAVIERQLKTFEKRFLEGRKPPKNLHDIVTAASMVQLEGAKDDERPKIAGVIENRLEAGMPLQIDATINYALQKWRPLARSEYQSVDHPFNTYRNKGLPPGPICSPSLASLRAAEDPQEHGYLYYVAHAKGGYHMFAATYGEHLRNIARRKAEQAEAKP